MDRKSTIAGNARRIRLVLAIFFMALPVWVSAEATISSGFLAKSELSAGTIVAQSADPEVVVAANSSNIKNLLGVVSASSAIAFTTGTGQVQIVSTGATTAFVSDAKGDIKAGDRLTVGELSGVGVKLSGSGKVIGVAQLDFNRSSAGAKIQELKDLKGKKHRVALGQIPVAVKITDYNAGAIQSSLVPQSIQLFFNHLLKRNVSSQAIIVVSLILLAGIVGAAVILYGATSGGMASLGRNPLSRQSVFRAFAQAALIALAIIAASSGLAYLAALLL